MLIAIGLSLLIGVTLGLLGGGGSILTLPVLRYVLDMDVHEAVVVSLIVVAATSAAAIIPHARRGRVHWRTALIFGPAGMVGAFAAGLVAPYLPAVLLLVLFSLVMLGTAAAMMRKRPEQKANPHASSTWKVVAEGLVVGVVTGLVGAGGGFLVVPSLVLWGGLSMEVAVGTSLAIIAMKSLAGVAGHLGHLSIDWPVALGMAGTAVVGSLTGAALAGRVSPTHLRKGFAWLVVVMAFFVLAQEVPRALGWPLGLGWTALVVALGTLGMALVMNPSSRCLPNPAPAPLGGPGESKHG